MPQKNLISFLLLKVEYVLGETCFIVEDADFVMREVVGAVGVPKSAVVVTSTKII